jgi:23S rRNA (cytidine1920-2'-O)/16S rRNA (cytidine1409-2'-O)-methyltransferase
VSTSSAPSSRAWPTWAAEIVRLDTELVRRGLARSRGDARDLVEAGLVQVAGVRARKPAQPVGEDTELGVDDAPRWVGRAAHKLAAALETWRPEGLAVAGRRCLDAGASTGGFTQVLLGEGAAHVVAVDVGHGQLVPEIASDHRVEDRSGTTVRGLGPEDVGGPVDVLVADLSFISLTLVVPDLAGLLVPGGDAVLLVKPQFEVGRARLGSSGVVTDPADRADAVLRVVAAARDAGLGVRGLVPSPVTGGSGNTEYLLWARSDPSGTMSEQEVRAVVRAMTTDHASGGRR